MNLPISPILSKGDTRLPWHNQDQRIAMTLTWFITCACAEFLLSSLCFLDLIKPQWQSTKYWRRVPLEKGTVLSSGDIWPNGLWIWIDAAASGDLWAHRRRRLWSSHVRRTGRRSSEGQRVPEQALKFETGPWYNLITGRMAENSYWPCFTGRRSACHCWWCCNFNLCQASRDGHWWSRLTTTFCRYTATGTTGLLWIDVDNYVYDYGLLWITTVCNGLISMDFL